MRTLAILLLSVLSSLSGAAAELPQTVKLLTEPLPPLSQYADGQASGFSVELARLIQRQLGEGAEVEVLPWARGYAMALRESNTVLFPTSLNDSRRQQFDFVGPFAEVRMHLYALSNDASRPKDLAEAASLGTIGAYRGSPAEKLLLDSKIPGLLIAAFPDQSLRQLLAGRIRFWCHADLFIGPLLSRAGVDEGEIQPVLELKRIGLYFAFSRGTAQARVEAWQQALQNLMQSGEFARLHRQWLGREATELSANILWREE
ncbi:substrate-binding periplasmic protein [Shewanella sedimentimangrovi]|uniref:Transporter substrate-binding domain-containing protein n=1 Tax=Shewanella sedimentimangrovi TaxID=2814293 RepID=A0ABX7R0G1_9GAMM|nr:transporter substrate-binding domain-containing protein [Shewanella sedimentimangrovi]QSX36368.1 transporter substrate-binding domain-containing protein [Shewanella sedimentimangrovi]